MPLDPDAIRTRREATLIRRARYPHAIGAMAQHPAATCGTLKA
jgi:hypothetical protein